jgi:hypothetical protein
LSLRYQKLLVLVFFEHTVPKAGAVNRRCLKMLVDCPGGVGSPDHCDANGPDLFERRLFGRSARWAGGLVFLRDVMTGLTRYLGELHFSSLMTLAVSHGRGESCEEPSVVMGA